MDLLTPRHPLDECHHSQLEALAAQRSVGEREHLAQQLRFGNATYRYYHQHCIEATETDYLEWLEGLPPRPQAAMRALGFEAHREALPLRRYVLEKNDIGLSEFLSKLLSPTDWQAYQLLLPAALQPWLPPLSEAAD